MTEEPLRFALAVTGVALSVMLMLVLGGMYIGINEQITAYLDNAPADLLVAQKGQRNFLGARSSVPSSTVALTNGIDGVEGAVPVIVQYVVLELHGRKEFTLSVGFYPESGGGPWKVTRGSAEIENGQVVLDEALARLRDLEIGDGMEVLGESFEIAGLSRGTSSFMTGTVFLTYQDAARLVAAKGPSFVLVELAQGADADDVARSIESAARAVTVTSRDRVDRNDAELYASILRGPVGFMVAVAFLIGVTIVALTTYTATIERAKDYGALKAIGAGNPRLYRVVLQQAALSTAVGSVLGVASAFIAAEVIQAANPRFLIAIGPEPIAVVAAIALAMGALAALAPAVALARIDPAIAFRKAV